MLMLKHISMYLTPVAQSTLHHLSADHLKDFSACYWFQNSQQWSHHHHHRYQEQRTFSPSQKILENRISERQSIVTNEQTTTNNNRPSFIKRLKHQSYIYNNIMRNIHVFHKTPQLYNKYININKKIKMQNLKIYKKYKNKNYM